MSSSSSVNDPRLCYSRFDDDASVSCGTLGGLGSQGRLAASFGAPSGGHRVLINGGRPTSSSRGACAGGLLA